MIDSKEPGKPVSSSSTILGYYEASAPHGRHIFIVGLAKEAHVSNHSKIHTEMVYIAGSLQMCWPCVSASTPAWTHPYSCMVTALLFKETSLVSMVMLLMSMSTLSLDMVISSLYTTTLFLFKEALLVYMLTLLLYKDTLLLYMATPLSYRGDTLVLRRNILTPHVHTLIVHGYTLILHEHTLPVNGGTIYISIILL